MLIVMKFGGTSVGSAERIVQAASLVTSALERGHRVAVVTSAMSGVTNTLIDAARSASTGKWDPQIRQRLLATHKAAAEAIVPDSASCDAVVADVDRRLDRFEKLCYGLSMVHELTHLLQWRYSADPQSEFKNHFDRIGAVWFVEGWAEYVGWVKKQGDGYVFGQDSPLRMEVYQVFRKMELPLYPLQEFVKRESYFDWIREVRSWLMKKIRMPTEPAQIAAIDEVYFGMLYSKSWLFMKFLYDGQNVVLDYLDPDGPGPAPFALKTRYLHGPAVDQVLAVEDVTAPVGDAARVLWYLTDQQGTTRDLVNHAGVAVAHYNYDAFGNVLAGDTSLTRYLYTGREFDAATGLQYNRNRWYDAATGRWLSQDPIGFAATFPSQGRYRLLLQFQHEGQVQTVAFTQEVR